LTRWSDAQEKITQVKDDDIRVAMWALYHLIRHTYDVIPEVE
jgi:hypothetical protein